MNPPLAATAPLSPTVPLADGVDAVGILHGRLEFAACVRRALAEGAYDAVAVELPVTLEGLYRQAVAALPAATLVEVEWDDGDPAFLFVGPQDGLAEAVRSADERGIPVHFVDQDVDAYPLHHEAFPDSYLVTTLGLPRYQQLVEPLAAAGPADASREATMAHHLHRLRERHARVLFVGGWVHLPGLREALAGPPPPRPLARVARREGQVFAIHPDTLARLLVLGEAPYLAAAYEVARAAGRPAPDRVEEAARLVALSREHHLRVEGEALAPNAVRTLFRYARNLAREGGAYVPGLLEWITAARGVADDNLARAVLEVGGAYPFPPPKHLPVRRLTHEEVERLSARGLRLRPTLKRPRPRPASLRLRRRAQEERRGDWAKRWEESRPTGQCSFPPEDVVIEAAGRRVQEVAASIVKAARRRTGPFVAGLQDGLDLRETLRHWHEGRVYVRDEGPGGAGVGSVVVIFDEDDGADAAGAVRYPWEMTWWGEHDQESDLAFYATPPEADLVGPGIGRCEYGGFMMTWPPGRLAEVWSDPYYQHAASRAERLVLAALEYSVEDHVAYVAARPPRARWRSLAEGFGRRLVYVPLGALATETQRRIRRFHVLSDHKLRAVAADYIC